MHAARQIFQVHLMHDAETRRHDAEGIERLHAPFHELVALVIALEFQLHVQIERITVAEMIDLHRMVHHQIDRNQRLDILRLLAHFRRHTPHCGQVGQQRNAGKVLQYHTRNHERDFIDAGCRRTPVR